jgi:hypothetical protein
MTKLYKLGKLHRTMKREDILTHLPDTFGWKPQCKKMATCPADNKLCLDCPRRAAELKAKELMKGG